MNFANRHASVLFTATLTSNALVLICLFSA